MYVMNCPPLCCLPTSHHPYPAIPYLGLGPMSTVSAIKSDEEGGVLGENRMMASFIFQSSIGSLLNSEKLMNAFCRHSGSKMLFPGGYLNYLKFSPKKTSTSTQACDKFSLIMFFFPGEEVVLDHVAYAIYISFTLPEPPASLDLAS